MKNKILYLSSLIAIAFTVSSFTTIDVSKKEVKIEKSKIVWTGYKITGSHAGTIGLKSGTLIFTNEKLTGGEFTIDMTSLICTDLEGEYKGKMEGHLKSDDFFGVNNYPAAKLVFKKVETAGTDSYKITGDLTIKGITHDVIFNASVNGKKAAASLKVDRTKYNVKYGSASFFDGLGDKAINNEFDLVVEMEF